MNATVPDPGPSGSQKWGDTVLAGFQPVPDALLIKQQELELDQTDMLVLLNLTSYWWFRDRPPFPRTNVIAKRMGVSVRTVQRVLKKLESKGYVRRDQFTDHNGNTMPAVYFDGLVEKLAVLTKNDGTLSLKMSRATVRSIVSEEVDFS